MLMSTGLNHRTLSAQDRIRYIRSAGPKWKAKTSACSLYLALYSMYKVRTPRRMSDDRPAWQIHTQTFSA
ncbi:hypothetical protein L6R29_07130 [Myxococcota bacterium]|nr:hypothetical protein [Myxococcota bacterium]